MITCIQPRNVRIKSENVESRQKKAVLGTGSTGLKSGNAGSIILAGAVRRVRHAFHWECRGRRRTVAYKNIRRTV